MTGVHFQLTCSDPRGRITGVKKQQSVFYLLETEPPPPTYRYYSLSANAEGKTAKDCQLDCKCANVFISNMPSVRARWSILGYG